MNLVSRALPRMSPSDEILRTAVIRRRDVRIAAPVGPPHSRFID